jgi:hypothetical protein
MSLKDLTDLIQSGAIIASIVEILALFYQAPDIINSIRSSFGYEGEGKTRKPGPNESPKDKDALDQAYVLIERYNRHVDLFSRLHALRYRFMAQFGPDTSTPFDNLNRAKRLLETVEIRCYATHSEPHNI